MIGIIGAMEEEVSALLNLSEVKETSVYQGYTFYSCELAGKPVTIVQGGIGKVNAAISATLLIEKYNVNTIINIGSAGGLHLDQNVGDVVISNHVAHHDVDVTAFGRKIGEVPGLPQYFEPNKELLNKVEKILKSLNMVSHTGLIVSGDQFICRDEQVNVIKENFPDAMCAEMEAASIAQVAHVYNKDFIITRSLSDIFNKGENSVQFDEYLRKASASSAKMCYELVKSL